MIATFTRDEARALLAFASRDPARTSLHGVIVDPATASVCATDGHTALRATLPYPPHADVSPNIIHYDVWARVLAAARKKTDTISVAVDLNGATISVGEVRIEYRWADAGSATPPNCGQVFEFAQNDTDRAEIVGFDGVYLERVGRTMKQIGAKSVKLSVRGGCSTQIFDFVFPAKSENPIAWTALVAPVRL